MESLSNQQKFALSIVVGVITLLSNIHLFADPTRTPQPQSFPKHVRNSNLDNGNQFNKKKKNLYLHVGPGNMATATIQNSMIADESLLQKDGYCIFPMYPLGEILLTTQATSTETAEEQIQSRREWQLFMSKLDQCHEQHKHVLLSSKWLGLVNRSTWDILLEPAFERWNFVVVVGYRRYYEWLPSVYFQLYQGAKDTDIPSMETFIHSVSKPQVLYTENYLRHWMSLVRYGGTSSTNDKKQDNNEFDFLVYNMHDNHNVLKTLYCNVLPSTTTTCHKYSQDMQYVSRVQSSIDYDRLIIAATKAGKIHGYDDTIDGTAVNKLARELEKMWEEKWQKTVMDFPRNCLTSSQLDDLFEKSMNWEKLIVPEYYKESVVPNKYQVEREFRAMAKDKLCSVKVDRVVHDAEFAFLWNGFERKRNGVLLRGRESKFGYKWYKEKPMYIAM